MNIETLWKYNEDGRHYHALSHIATMMKLVKEHGLKLNIAQKIAIAHHDTVYCFGREDNEDRSATRMFTEEYGKYSDKTINTAYKIILSTAKHVPMCKDACDVIDLDLFGLSDEKTYWTMAGDVGDEYIPKVGLERWNQGRSQWLQHMLDKKQIYHGFWKGHDEDAKILMRCELAARVAKGGISVPNSDGVVREERDP